MFLGVSDVVWQTLIAAAVTIILAWMQQRTGKTVVKSGREAAAQLAVTTNAAAQLLADAATNQAMQVKASLDRNLEHTEAKLDDIATVGHETHRLVNSGYLALLRTTAVALRRIAALTKDVEDSRVAEAAENLCREHEARQGQTD